MHVFEGIDIFLYYVVYNDFASLMVYYNYDKEMKLSDSFFVVSDF